MTLRSREKLNWSIFPTRIEEGVRTVGGICMPTNFALILSEIKDVRHSLIRGKAWKTESKKICLWRHIYFYFDTFSTSSSHQLNLVLANTVRGILTAKKCFQRDQHNAKFYLWFEQVLYWLAWLLSRACEKEKRLFVFHYCDSISFTSAPPIWRVSNMV